MLFNITYLTLRKRFFSVIYNIYIYNITNCSVRVQYIYRSGRKRLDLFLTFQIKPKFYYPTGNTLNYTHLQLLTPC